MGYTTLSPEEIKTKVYQETKKQFLLRGINNTELKQIAKTVGIGRTTLYRYFPSRDQLAFMVTCDLVEIFLNSSIAPLIDPKLNGFDKLKKHVDIVIDRIMEHPEVLSYFSEFDQIFAKDYPDFPEAREYDQRMIRSIEAIAEYMVLGQNDGSIKQEDPVQFTAMVLNTVMGLGQRVIIRGSHHGTESSKTDAMLRKVAKTLLDTIKV